MSDKQRVEFEKWFKENHTQNVQKINGEYVHGSTERLWQAWQAAIASVVVELPTLIIDEYANGETLEHVEMSELKKSLTEAGIRYE